MGRAGCLFVAFGEVSMRGGASGELVEIGALGALGVADVVRAPRLPVAAALFLVVVIIGALHVAPWLVAAQVVPPEVVLAAAAY